MTSQAERIIARFGGVAQVRRALAHVKRPRDRSTIHRWKAAGSKGIIPASAVADLRLAAAHAKESLGRRVELTKNDWAP